MLVRKQAVDISGAMLQEMSTACFLCPGGSSGALRTSSPDLCQSFAISGCSRLSVVSFRNSFEDLGQNIYMNLRTDGLARQEIRSKLGVYYHGW